VGHGTGEGALLVAEQFDSSSALGMAAQLMSTNGAWLRLDAACSARATKPLPVPVSP
jgi:hypothetical protein